MSQSDRKSQRRRAPSASSGISMSVQIAGVLGGGVAPMIGTALLAYGGGRAHYVIAYMVVLAVIGFVCTLLMRSHHD